MGIKIKVLAFLIGFGFFFFVLRSIKRDNLNPSYSILWILLAIFLISIPAAEPIYQWLATSVIGIVDARHIIYIVLIGFLLVYLFYLTQKVSHMADKIQILITHVAMLEACQEAERPAEKQV